VGSSEDQMSFYTTVDDGDVLLKDKLESESHHSEGGNLLISCFTPTWQALKAGKIF
jgi:hypothetical protein